MADWKQVGRALIPVFRESRLYDYSEFNNLEEDEFYTKTSEVFIKYFPTYEDFLSCPVGDGEVEFDGVDNYMKWVMLQGDFFKVFDSSTLFSYIGSDARWLNADITDENQEWRSG
jgi:hypothetical protein